MSSFDFATRGARLAIVSLAVGVTLALSSCQVRPLYADGASGGTAKALGAIEISEATDRVGQQVRNNLIFLTSGGAGEPAVADYNLALTVTHETRNVLYDKRNDRDMAAAGRIVVRADYNLTRVKTGETIRSGNRTAIALVDFPVQEFAKLRAIRDGQDRAAKELAEVIRADLAAALGR
jgi:LPS-assembly lipoprotein